MLEDLAAHLQEYVKGLLDSSVILKWHGLGYHQAWTVLPESSIETATLSSG